MAYRCVKSRTYKSSIFRTLKTLDSQTNSLPPHVNYQKLISVVKSLKQGALTIFMNNK